MPENKNALAELAETMNTPVEIMPGTGDSLIGLNRSQLEAYKKAIRIVAELVKVVDCKKPELIMPLEGPYDDITLWAPYDNGLTESNSINEDEKRFILDLANAAWKCRAIAEEGGAK